MSLSDLCTGDTVIVETATHSVGAAGGDVQTWSGSTSYDCLVQTEGAEAVRHSARGQQHTHLVFFSADVSLDPLATNARLKWTVKAGVTLATPRYLRVLAYYSEGRPGEDMLWIAKCELVTVRKEGN